MTEFKASIYLDIISQIPLEISTSSYGKAYQNIRERIEEDSLIDNTRNYINNLENIEKFLHENQSLKYWENFGEKFER